jgi:Na+-translocating ferredoxin:NAD+ oxidoreductase RnfD subunit
LLWTKTKRLFKTPKGILILILVVLAAIAAPHEGLRIVLPGMLGAMAAAGIVDAIILRVRKKSWDFPDGALLTAMIVSMVLRAQEPWHVVALTSVAAVLSKYLFRSKTANVFNPAGLAVVASFYVFHTGQSWWGALTEVPAAAQIVLVALGLFIVDRVNKMPLVLVFLGTYFLLFTATAYLQDPRRVAEIYRSPDIEAALFFAFIILTDPPTSPAKYPDQIVCGALVALVSYGFFEWFGVVYYLLGGLLVGNVWEAWRRVSRRTRTGFPQGLGPFLLEISPLPVRR